MKFFIHEKGASRSQSASRPYAVLNRDTWDDYRYKVSFRLEIFLEGGDVLDLGQVKICSAEMSSGEVMFPSEVFDSLPDMYFSLGQQFTYYELLVTTDPGMASQVLIALQDAAFNPEIAERYFDHPGFQKALIRDQSAERALYDARRLFEYQPARRRRDSLAKAELTFQFRTSVGGERFDTEFKFGDRRHLPNRVSAVIGYNRAGKTQLMANLAIVAQANKDERAETEFREKYGNFVDMEPTFGAVVTVSYSAFDTFETPSVENRAVSNYTYCGLRRRKEGDDEDAIKTPAELTNDFLTALVDAQREGRLEILHDVLNSLAKEPSFEGMNVAYALQRPRRWESLSSEARRDFEILSTGHKIVLNIAVNLVANLQLRSLILIDEPESHLHPPLLAALLRAVSNALEARDSFAIIATHSPVVIQEIPGRYVHVLKRRGDQNFVESPEIETFGENVGQLTRTVFSLDSTATDYHNILDSLAQTFSLEQIEEMFDGRMSNQARSYVARKARRRSEGL